MADVDPIRGCVLVICNSFSGSTFERKSPSANEAEAMKQLWGDVLQCDSFPVSNALYSDFKVHHDLTAKDMKELLANFANDQTQITDPKYSYIAVVISTHGRLIAESWVSKWESKNDAKIDDVYDDFKKYCEEEKAGLHKGKEMVEIFFGSDFRPVKENKILELFNNDAAKGWQNVSKFFILNYCRGNAIDCIPRPTRISELEPTRQEPADSQEDILIPRVSDVVTVYATHHRYVPCEDKTEYGSWLLPTISEVFKKYKEELHVTDMLTIVNKKMQGKLGADESGKFGKVTSIYESSLERNVYLYVRPIRGCVLVISNSFVNKPGLERVEASERDATDMKELWGGILGCDSFPIKDEAEKADFVVQKDVSAQEMIELLTNFADCQTQTKYSYIAVVISSHGGLAQKRANFDVDGETYEQAGKEKNKETHAVIYGNDYRPVSERKIKKLFYNDAAPRWQNIPKFFILDYCRGRAVDHGVIPRPPSALKNNMQLSPNTVQTAVISNMLAVHATHYRYVAVEGAPEYGSWLLSTIFEVFRMNAGHMHVVDMLTLVNEKMKKKWAKVGGAGHVKAMSIYESSLKENLYLCDEAKKRLTRNVVQKD